MENGSHKKNHKLPSEADIERASLEAAQRAIREVSRMQRAGHRAKFISFIPALKVAAMLAVLSGLAVYFYQHHKSAPRNISVKTQPGERRQVVLPDGSVAELNAASAITYPEHFDNLREVTLSGEAFFKVQRNAERPFVVHSDRLDVRVLGTSFNIKSYALDAHARVTVASGKVSVNNPAKANAAPAILLPGDQLTFENATSLFSKRKVEPSDAADWQKQVLDFEFQTLAHICQELGRVYGVTIHIENPRLAARRFQLRVQNESLDNILQLLSISGGGFSYRRDGKTVIVK